MAVFKLGSRRDMDILVPYLRSLGAGEITYVANGPLQRVIQLYDGPDGTLWVSMHPHDLERFAQLSKEDGSPLKPVVDRPGENN